jgi:hypothetical protein
MRATCLLLVLGFAGTAALAQPADDYALALRAYRNGDWSGAYGRFVALANDGNVEAARSALFMVRNGPTLYHANWDADEDDLDCWRHLVDQAAARDGVRVQRVANEAPPRRMARPWPWAKVH